MSKTVTKFSSGPACQPAMNTAPPVVAPKSIAGYGAMKTSGGFRGPTYSAGSSAFNSPSHKMKGPRMSGGPSRAGPQITQGGTSSPSSKPGPSGIGESGNQYPTGGGG